MMCAMSSIPTSPARSTCCRRSGGTCGRVGRGRILITGSIAGFMPGTYQAVYNGTKAMLDSFSFALRHELKDTGVTVTCLMPGPTETEFFERADMLDTKVGQAKKDDPADVARIGFDAMMKGQGDVVSGWKNKLQSAIATVTPSGVMAEMHRGMAEPGTGKKYACVRAGTGTRFAAEEALKQADQPVVAGLHIGGRRGGVALDDQEDVAGGGGDLGLFRLADLQPADHVPPPVPSPSI